MEPRTKHIREDKDKLKSQQDLEEEFEETLEDESLRRKTEELAEKSKQEQGHTWD